MQRFVLQKFIRFVFAVTGNYRELIDYLNGSTELLAKNGNILDNVLETLDNHQHSLGVLYVLVAKLTNLTVRYIPREILKKWLSLLI